MKKSIFVIVILAAVFVTGAILVTACSSKKSEQHEHKAGEEHKGGTAHEGHEMDSTSTAYACPMHPEITGKQGDKCSKCGMTLEPVKSNDSTEHGRQH